MRLSAHVDTFNENNVWHCRTVMRRRSAMRIGAIVVFVVGGYANPPLPPRGGDRVAYRCGSVAGIAHIGNIGIIA
jgi:hypothetical protein